MKRFVISVLSVAVFFVGLGSLADKVGAKFKSDEKALEIVRKARTAIGGDSAIAGVRSLTIVGRSTHTVNVDGTERSEQGETEIALQFPDKLMRMVKMGHADGTGERALSRQHGVVLLTKGEGEKVMLEGHDGEIVGPERKKFTIIKRADGDASFTTEDGKNVIVRKIEAREEGALKVRTGDPSAAGEKRVMINRHAPDAAHAGIKQNELLRIALSLLLKAPEGIDVNYTFVGESDVVGAPVNVVNAEFGGANYKLFISRLSNLPVAMSYSGHAMPSVVRFTKELTASAEGPGDVVVFNRKLEGEPARAEHFVRFSDFRSTGGVLLPYKWTTSVNGKAGEVFDVTSYEINPANIAEKFGKEKVFVRTAKPIQN